MEGRRTEKGYFEIRRGAEFAPQYCPFDQSQQSATCGDWCPLFGEPYKMVGQGRTSTLQILHLCHAKLAFDKFEDLREGVKDEED